MKKKIIAIEKILLPLLLIVYSMSNIRMGLSVGDEGYNYGNFIAFNSLDHMWKFSTYISQALGAFFTHLPFGHTMMGLNFYTRLVKASVALFMYFFAVYGLKMKRGAAFVTQLAALGFCWGPSAILYNYLTYLNLCIGSAILYLGVKNKRERDYYIAGIFFGLNVLVRLPNVIEVSLILAVWVAAIFMHDKFKIVVLRTLLCIGGFFTGALPVLCIIFVKYGISDYIKSIAEMLSLSQRSTSYSFSTMLYGPVQQYIYNARWVGCWMILAFLGILMFKIFGKRFILLKSIAMVILNVGLLKFFYDKRCFDFDYTWYRPIDQLSVTLMIIAGMLVVYTLIFEKKPEKKMQAMLVGLIILITPIGSNNYLLAVTNNLFFVLPFVAGYFMRLCTYGKEWVISLEKKEISLPTLPVKITAICVAALMLVQSFVFGLKFTYWDGFAHEKMDVEITDNAVLKGMRTGETNGALLNSINAYLNKENLKGSDAVLFGYLPAFAFFFELKPAIPTSWPDLESYSTEKFRADMEALFARVKAGEEKPLLVMAVPLEYDMNTEKMEIVRAFAKALDYKLAYSYEEISIYR